MASALLMHQESRCVGQNSPSSLYASLEVFRSEMEYAMEHGSAGVLKKLKAEGHYPYSDLDRKPVY
jgi:hypothetical protein